MITGLEVGAIFRIVDEATIPLRRMAEQVGAFDKEVLKAAKNLAELGRIKFPGLSGELKALSDQGIKLGDVFKTAMGDMTFWTCRDDAGGGSARWRMANSCRRDKGGRRSHERSWCCRCCWWWSTQTRPASYWRWR